MSGIGARSAERMRREMSYFRPVKEWLGSVREVLMEDSKIL